MKPYYVTFSLHLQSGSPVELSPPTDIGAPIDVRIGKFHGADIRMQKIEEEIRKKYGYGLDITIVINGVFPL